MNIHFSTLTGETVFTFFKPRKKLFLGDGGDSSGGGDGDDESPNRSIEKIVTIDNGFR